MNKKCKAGIALAGVALFSSLVFGTTSAAENKDAADQMVNQSGKVMVGYWHNWASKGDGYAGGSSKAMNLRQIHKGYNVVDVSFMKSTGQGLPTFKPSSMSDAEFRKQVAELNAEGRSVLIALGGADAHIELYKGQEQAFANEIIRLVEAYGFDGLDIDLEQSAISAADNQTVIPTALKIVKNHYKKEGKNFLITMAPEFPHLRTNAAYVKYIQSLEGYYDWINPQFYNQAGDGVTEYKGQGSWLAQNNDSVKARFLYSAISHLSENTGQFGVKIPSNKLVIGLPSNKDAGGNGYVQDPKALKEALEMLKADKRDVKGLMTWSVNWDNGQDANGKSYNWEFVTRYKNLLDGEMLPEIPEQPEQPEQPEVPEVPEVPEKPEKPEVPEKPEKPEKPEVPIGTSWDVSKVYNGGEIVTYGGLEYKAKWWTKGDTPNTSDVWELVSKGTSVGWTSKKAYNGGDKVTFKGKTYQAKWWTKGEQPDISSVWTQIK